MRHVKNFGVCGEPNLLRSAGHRMVCSNEECARQSFPRIDPAIIVLVTHKDAVKLSAIALDDRWSNIWVVPLELTLSDDLQYRLLTMLERKLGG